MPRSRKARSPAERAPQLLHRAARIEDRFHEYRARRGRKRGLVTTVIPYSAYGAPGWARVLCRVVLTKPDASDRHRYERVRGWRSFFSIPVNDGPVIVTIGGIEHEVMVDRGGVVDARVEASLEPGWHELLLRTADTEPVTAPLFIVDPNTRFGIVSDVDDTVMVTYLPRPFLAAWNTFVLDEHARNAVPGMPVLYDRLAKANPGAPIIYLSTGAWNVAPTLTRFMTRNLYPQGALLLTDWGPTHDRLFRSGRAHKEENLERLAVDFPDLRWLLIGDDGQHDEDIYGSFVERHPERVIAVAIRQLSTSEAVFAGGRRHGGHPGSGKTPWVYAPDGAGLSSQLTALGVLG
ncbi:App1 family protein [Salinibacterium sp. ZJ450]|uniref:App1 family protein n=1 Tax=Salinibacterium sp. ZJ450 TaxID=2708338 RepID=UPI001423BD3D|nr:phosphatase domain-containing protein [Salinibacterium sp. ZJ450]